MSRKARSAHGEFRRIEPPRLSAAGPSGHASRQARLPSFLGMPKGAVERLHALRAMVVGSGSVGGSMVLHLARLGIKEIWIVDPGRLKPESLLTHPIDPSAVGSAKVDYFGDLAGAISPKTGIYVFAGPVQSLSLAALARVDVVAMATDNLAAEVEVGQRCMHHRRTLFQASVHGDTLVAQARLWLNRDGSGACPVCSFGRAEWDHVNRETTFSCGGNGDKPQRHVATAPTMSVSFLCSTASDMAMTQLLRHVLELGPPLEDSMIECCGYTNQMSSSPLEKNSACPCRHEAWLRAPLQGPLARSSLADVAGRAGFDRGGLPNDLAFMVDDLTYVDELTCCGKPHSIGRFCEAGAQVAHCPHCGLALTPQLFFSYRPTPATVLSGRIRQPLHRLGAGAARWVLVRGGGRSVFCQEET